VLLCSLAFPRRDFPGELVAGFSVKQVVDTAKCAHRLSRFLSDMETVMVIVHSLVRRRIFRVDSRQLAGSPTHV
jgi:hypothetical protein